MKHRGMGVNVERAMRWREVDLDLGARRSREHSHGKCLTCGAALDFQVLGIREGGYGQTVEVCTNGACPGRFPHRPTPDLSGKPPRDPHPQKKRRRKAA